MGSSVTLNATGGNQSFTVPADVTSLGVDLYGAQGGGTAGGRGARVQGSIPVTPNEVLTLRVATQAGWPNGGAGTTVNALAGGGATELLRGSTLLATAAGGGGASFALIGGAGGAATGGKGQSHAAAGTAGLRVAEARGTHATVGGNGGTQSAGGSNGGGSRQGGNGLTGIDNGGGGGGYFGGGGGYGQPSNTGESSYGAGGGGSSLAPAGTTATGDVRSGNGVAVLTYNRAPGAPGAFTAPGAGTVFSGSHTVSWGAAADPDGDAIANYELSLSRDGGATWTVLSTANNTSRAVDFSGVAATNNAKLRVRATDGSLWGGYRESAVFTINRTPPTPGAFTAPASGASVSGTSTAAWGASTDPDGQTVTYRLEISLDNGATWALVAEGFTGASRSVAWTNYASTTAAKLRVRATDPYGATSDYQTGPTFTIQHNQAPTAPTELTPTGNPTLNRAQAQRLGWKHNDPDPGDAQSKYDLQTRLTGGAWTLVTATTTSQFRDLAAGSLAVGSYEWQVRTYDQLGVVSPWSALGYFTMADSPPAPSITAPANNGTVSETGVLTWSYPSQSAYQVQVLDTAGTVLEDSGQVNSTTARSHPLTFPTNNVQRDLRVRVLENGLWSAWSTVRVTVSFSPPRPAALTVVARPTLAAIEVGAVPGRKNLLPTDAAASFEDGTIGGWASDTGILANAVGGSHGVRSLAVPMPLDGGWNAYTARFPVGPGVPVTAALDTHATASRPGRLSIYYWDAANVVLGATHAAFAGLNTGAWDTRRTVTGTTLASTASVSVRVDNNSTIGPAGTLYLDAVQLEAGPDASLFSLPTAPNPATVALWRRVRGSGGDGELVETLGSTGGTFLDLSAAHQVDYEYRVVVTAQNGATTSGPWTP